MEDFLKEYRCPTCNKLIFKGKSKHAVIEIKCKRCKIKTVISEEAPGIALIKSDFTSERPR